MGYAQEELIGAEVARVQSDRNPEELGGIIHETTLREGGWSGRCWNRRKDGSEIWVDLTAQRLADESGERVWLVGWLREVMGPNPADERLLETLSEASALITRRMDSESLLRQMNLLLRQGLGLDRAGIWRLEGNALQGTWGTDDQGEPMDERLLFRPLSDDGDALTVAVRSGFPSSSSSPYHVALPICVNGETLGVLSVDNGPSGRPLSPEMLKPLALFADYIGIGLRNARMQDEIAAATQALQQRAEQLQTLLYISRELALEWVPSRLFQEITRRAIDLLNAPCVDLYLLDGEDLLYVSGTRQFGDTSTTYQEHIVQHQRTPLDSNPFVAKSIQRGEPVVIREMRDPQLLPEEIEWGERNRVHSRLAVPIPGQEGPQGALVIIHAVHPHSFTEEDVQIASHLAASVAVILRNSERMEEIERLNEGLQHALDVERELAEERSHSDRLEGVLQTVRAVNHEINNPLQVVMGNAQLLEMKLSKSEQAGHYLQRLLEGCERLADVSSRLSQVVRAAIRPSPAGDMLDLSEAVRSSSPPER